MSAPWAVDPPRESQALVWSAMPESQTEVRQRERLALALVCERCVSLTLTAWRSGLSATVRCGADCWHGPAIHPPGALRRALTRSHVEPERGRGGA